MSQGERQERRRAKNVVILSRIVAAAIVWKTLGSMKADASLEDRE